MGLLFLLSQKFHREGETVFESGIIMLFAFDCKELFGPNQKYFVESDF